MHSRYLTKSRPWRVLLGFAAFWLACNAAGAMAQPAVNPQATPQAGTRTQSPPREKANSTPETYQGMQVGFIADSFPVRGNPNAPLTLVEYSDYLCPFCARYFGQTLPVLLEKYGRTGQVQFVFRDFPLAALHPTAPMAAAAALCVADQGAPSFWQMHDTLFQSQLQWNRLPDPAAFLAEVVKKVGADMPAYEQCVASGRKDVQVQQSMAAGQALGFNGTPSFQFVHHPSGKTYTLVGAQPVVVFTRWIDALLAGQEPPQAEQPQQAQKPELPFWATPEGLAPDPKRPGYTVAGDAYRGNPNAKLVIVEFEDFQCPACQHHALTTQFGLDQRFIETGEVLWVSKHFPLRSHPHAPVAAAAAECAGDQGKFWAMHHQLFQRMEQWATSDDPELALRQLAADLDLDRPQFSLCLQSRPALERVLHDLYDGQGIGIRNIPAFILYSGGTGRVLVGARSPEQFVALVQQQLEMARSGN